MKDLFFQQGIGFHLQCGLSTVNPDCLGTELLIQRQRPVHKTPAQFIIIPDQLRFRIKLCICQYQLMQCYGQQIVLRRLIPGRLYILQKGWNEKQRIIEHEGIIRLNLGFCKQAGGNPAFLVSGCGKQIQAAFHQIIIMKSNAVGQCLQTQITQPQAAIALGTVLKEILHTVSQRSQGRPVNGDILFITDQGNWNTVIRRGGDFGRSILYNQLIFGRKGQYVDFHITESITAGKGKNGRQYVNMHLLLLHPALADPAGIAIQGLIQLQCIFAEFDRQPDGSVRMASL